MSGLSYETVARFAQQGGTVFFVLMFIASLIYALWPRNAEKFKRLAALSLDDSEDHHVAP